MTDVSPLVDELEASGVLAAEWVAAFRSVPRHLFVPDTVWWRDPQVAGMHDLVPLTRRSDPQTWLAMAYRDDSVITQVDDGEPTGPGRTGRAISSSASRPSVVAAMLDALRVEPGMTVCEIGTGTGYNAALLAHRLGSGCVTTIEIDERVAQQARAALDRADLPVRTIVGDGTLDHHPAAPYDRILSTCAVTDVPYSWVAQVRPGGRIVTPWGTAFHNGGLLALTVDGHGEAVGELIGTAAFMWERGQRSPRTRVRDVYSIRDDARLGATLLPPAHVVSSHDPAHAVGLRVPRCKYIYSPADDDSGEFTLWLLDQGSRSWASVDHAIGATSWEVAQFGPRDLWTEVEATYHWWTARGRPGATDWTFRVTADGQRTRVRPTTLDRGPTRPIGQGPVPDRRAEPTHSREPL